MNIKNRIRMWIAGNGDGATERIFIAFFYASCIVFSIFHKTGFQLRHFDERPLSIATSADVDIRDRVNYFYLGIFLFIFLTALVHACSGAIRSFLSKQDFKILNGTALAGFCLVVLTIFGINSWPAIHLIFGLHLSFVIGIILRKIFPYPGSTSEDALVFTGLTLISVCLFIPAGLTFHKLTGIHLHSLPLWLVLFYPVVHLLHRSGTSRSSTIAPGEQRTWTAFFLQKLRLLPLFPLLPVVATELWLILEHLGIHFLSGKILFAAFTIAILTFSILPFIRRKNTLSGNSEIDLSKLIFGKYIPWILGGLVCLALYQPVISPSVDWFEDANRIIPLQQFYEFGKIPFIHTFSSHALSDFIWGFMYSFLNGYHPLGGFMYEFLLQVIMVLVVYQFIRFITGDGFFAIWIAFFYPLTATLIPTYYNIVPVTAMMLYMLTKTPSVRNYFLFFSLLIFVLFWRIDLGVANFVAAIGSFLTLAFFLPGFRPEWKTLSKGLLRAGVPWIVLGGICWIRFGHQIPDAIKTVLGYISSFQSYGNVKLAIEQNAIYFALYFILPAAVVVTLGYLIYRLTRGSEKQNLNIPLVVALLFLSLFYFANLQRGLVRHTLFEQWDTALTSFGFLILSSTVFLNQKSGSIGVKKFFRFFLLSAFLVMSYSFGFQPAEATNVYDGVSKRFQTTLLVPGILPAEPRIKGNASSEPWLYSDLDDFMKKNFSAHATFFDFSNSPMLYSFLHRSTPDYLCQDPHTAHDDRMQDYLIARLKKADIPVVLFSNSPRTYWDHMDGIPNALRHYKISSWIYHNYKPYAILNGREVWVKKDLKLPVISKKSIYRIDNFHEITLSNAEQTDSVSFKTGNGNPTIMIRNFENNPMMLRDGKSYFLSAEVWSDHAGKSTIRFTQSFTEKQQEIEFTVSYGHNDISVALPGGELKTLTGISWILPENARVIIPSVTIYECDMLPDFASTQQQDFPLQSIPYAWGQFDKAYLAGEFSEAASVSSERKIYGKDQEERFSVSGLLYSHADFLEFKAKSISGKPVDVILNYGSGSEKSGGFSFRISGNTSYGSYVIPCSTQYNWYRSSPGWISIYPVGQDIEISSIRLLNEEAHEDAH